MSSLAAKATEEIVKALPPTIFLFIIFHGVSLTRSFMLKDAGIQLGTTASAPIASLVVGKSVLVADTLAFINAGMPDLPCVDQIEHSLPQSHSAATAST